MTLDERSAAFSECNFWQPGKYGWIHTTTSIICGARCNSQKHSCAIIRLKIMECECWSVSNMAAMFFNLSIQCEQPLEARWEGVVSRWIPASLIISAGCDCFQSVWGEIKGEKKGEKEEEKEKKKSANCSWCRHNFHTFQHNVFKISGVHRKPSHNVS